MTIEAPTLQLIEVDPRTLEVNPVNVRRETKNIDELAASIAKIGVQVPLTVRSNGNSHYTIVAGHRRALAAIKAGVTTVPVIVHDYADGGQAELTAMMVENLHREDLTAADEAKGFEQLAAFGMSIDDIAQLTGRDKTRVTTGLAVAKSTTSSAVAARYDLTLEQAAGIAEFDGDNTVVKELTFASQKAPEQFDHLLQRARQERERVTARAAKCAELQSAGVKKILGAGKRFGWALQAKEGVYLSELVDAKGKQLTPAGHKSCPGHAAEVDHWGRQVTYGCTDPKTNGHKTRVSSSGARSAGVAKKSGSSAAEKAKAAAAKLKAEEDGKAIEAATVVRRKFVRDLLARKTAPKGTLAYVVPQIIEHADELYEDAKIVEQLTGAKPKSGAHVYRPLLQLTEGASDGRLLVVLLAFVGCCHESAEWDGQMLSPRSYQNFKLEARWLQFLAACGYGLSEIEQRIITVAFPPAKASRAAKRKAED